MSVSVLTVTQWRRRFHIPILVKLINRQTYKQIVEWVVVNGTSDPLEHEQLSCYLNRDIRPQLREGIQLRYFGTEDIPLASKTIGSYRERATQSAKGDYLVNFDDDDFYREVYIEHAVESMQTKKTQLAGCTRNYIYDLETNTIFQFLGFGPNHTVNCTLACTKEYTKTHHYQSHRSHAEEQDFLNQYREPMAQMDPEKTILQMSYGTNTYNKREIILKNMIAQLQSNQYTCQIVNRTLREMIGDERLYQEYQQLFELTVPAEVSPYDIVYYLGIASPSWDPEMQDLGGSEQAVLYLSREWVRKKRSVCVYGQFDFEKKTVEGVDYRQAKQFSIRDKYKVLILWRMFGMLPFFPLGMKFQCEQLLVDLHDNFTQLYKVADLGISQISKLCFKSEFHKKMSSMLGKVYFPEEKCQIIKNGVRIEEFLVNREQVVKSKFRFCYVSCYTRGLMPILEHAWPLVYQQEPRAELHVYYGMDRVNDEAFKTKMKQLLSQPGVMDHGRQPVEIIAREKWQSGWHLYYTASTSEIDCISIQESLLTGAVPILSGYNVFPSRDGIHVKGDITRPEGYANLAKVMLTIMSQPDEKFAEIRKELKCSKLLVTWEEVAKQWIELFDGKDANVNGTSSEKSEEELNDRSIMIGDSSSPPPNFDITKLKPQIQAQSPHQRTLEAQPSNVTSQQVTISGDVVTKGRGDDLSSRTKATLGRFEMMKGDSQYAVGGDSQNAGQSKSISQPKNEIGSSPVQSSQVQPISVQKTLIADSLFKRRFILNLDRRPDRYTEFKERCKFASTSFTRIAAADGLDLPLEEVFVQGCLRYLQNREREEYQPGVFGCALSHYKIMKKVAEDENLDSSDLVLVLEDDVMYNPDFEKRFSLFSSQIRQLLQKEVGERGCLIYTGGRTSKNFVPNSEFLNKWWSKIDLGDDTNSDLVCPSFYERHPNLFEGKYNHQYERQTFALIYNKKAARVMVEHFEKEFDLFDIAIDNKLVQLSQKQEIQERVSFYDYFPHLFYSELGYKSDIQTRHFKLAQLLEKLPDQARDQLSIHSIHSQSNVSSPTVVNTKVGLILVPDFEHVAIKSLAEKGFYEQEVVDLISRFTKDNSIALDIGAGMGIHTLTLAKHCEEVHSFVPRKIFYQHLLENIKLNGISNVIPYQCFLGKEKSAVQFEGVETDVLTLDSLEMSQVDFIRIEMDGFEKEILTGSIQTLKRFKPVLLIKISGDTNATFAILDRIGYQHERVPNTVYYLCQPDARICI